MTEDLDALVGAADLEGLGRRVRQARVDRRLTQAELASGDVTIGYVQRLEAGNERPDAPLLGRLAQRLGVSATVLATGVPDPAVVALARALDDAELSMRGGSPADAVQRAGEVRAAACAAGLADLEHRARLVEGHALGSLGRFDGAIAELEGLVVDCAELSPLVLKAAIGISHCYRERGDLLEAQESGQRQLDRLPGTPWEGSDDAVKLILTVAAARYERGDLGQALRMCRRAIDQAERTGSRAAKGSACWNASVMEAAAGNLDTAVSLATEGVQLLEEAGDNRSLASLRTVLGRLLICLEPPQIDAAREHLEAARRDFRWSGATPVDLGWNTAHLARVDLLSDQVQRAEQRMTEVLEEVADSAPMLRAEALTLLGQCAALRGQGALAAQRYRAAVLQLSAIGSDRNAAEAWFDLGGLLDELGLQSEAQRAYRSAAAANGLVSTYRARVARPRVQDPPSDEPRGDAPPIS